MFTGLIEATGSIEAMQPNAGGILVRIRTPLAAELGLGASIAVNGVCLTVTATTASSFDATLSPETLRVSTLGQVVEGDSVNLERPIKADTRLGGHFVLGHVDGVGRIRSITPEGDCYSIEVDVPNGLLVYLIPKGSVALDGISLTVAAIRQSTIRIQIVPHTWANTSLSAAKAGDLVNIEADVIGKYVARLLGERLLQLQ